MKRFDPLTYRFPRTRDEAFPDDRVEHSVALFGYRQFRRTAARWAIRTTFLILTFFIFWCLI